MTATPDYRTSPLDFPEEDTQPGYAEGFLDGLAAAAEATLSRNDTARPASVDEARVTLSARFEVIKCKRLWVVRDYSKEVDFAFTTREDAEKALADVFRQGLGHELISRPLGFFDNI